MATRNHRIWLCLACLPLFPTLAALDCVGEFDSLECEKYVFKVPIYKCHVEMNPLQISFTSKGSCVAKPDLKHVDPDLGLRVNMLPYSSGEPWLISEVEPGQIRGALWIQTSWNMKNSYDQNGGILLTLLDAAEGVYLAYDSRVSPPPTWLMEPNWVAQKNKAGSAAYIRIDRPDGVNNRPYTNLAVYRSNQPATKDALFPLPGNLHQGPQQPTLPADQGIPGSKPDDICMYMVIVNPIKQYDCNYLKWKDPLATKFYDSCGNHRTTGGACKTEEVLKEEAKKAVEDCLKNDPKFPTGTYSVGEAHRDPGAPTRYCSDTPGAKPTCSKLIQPRVYGYNSEIEFNSPNCTATVDLPVDGVTTRTTSVSGSADFEYETDSLDRVVRIRINGLLLQAADIVTEDATFKNITVDLAAAVDANCADANAPWGMPCNSYRIEPNELVAAVSFDAGNGPVVAVGQNSDTFRIEIDHASRTFHLVGGPIEATLKMGGEDRRVAATFSLTGHFVNFAARIKPSKEYKDWSECDRTSRNKDDIVLDASESFDIYDQCPNSPANYEWYEDFALVTERLWGQDVKVTIAQGQLSFGVHKMTLVLRDNYGAVGIRPFDIEVRDTMPPKWNEADFPNNVIIMLEGPQAKPPVKVEPDQLGQATATDQCCAHVLITNDAPGDMMFGAGETPVTWQADDGRGNVATLVQKVIVIPLTDEPMKSAKDAAVHLRNETGGVVVRLADSGRDPNSVRDLHSLLRAIDQLLVWWNGASSSRVQDEQRAAVRQRLESAAGSVNAADSLLEQAGSDEARRAALRQEAVTNLNTAWAVMSEIAEMPEGTPLVPPPLCGFSVAAAMACLIMCVVAGRRLMQAWRGGGDPGGEMGAPRRRIRVSRVKS